MSKSHGFRDHCGVFGLFHHPQAAQMAYLGLHALQHRGQDSAGIVSFDGNQYHKKVGLGLVGDVFGKQDFSILAGHTAIGHVRYKTAGSSGLKDAQPLLFHTQKGAFAIAHNGNLTNATQLRQQLLQKGVILFGEADTEIIAHLFSQSPKKHPIDSLKDALSQVQGAYSLSILMEGCLVGARDPFGIRPLVLGQLGDAFLLASEDCAFQLIGAQRIREILPGEMVIIHKEGITSEQLTKQPCQPKQCLFEHVYFSRPDSHIFQTSVHEARLWMGRLLAKEAPASADAIVPVPDSGLIAAYGYANELQIPVQMGLVRNHYVGRTFIEPDQGIRNFGVKLKLSPVESVVSGKRVVVIDDSIVRGTTSKKIICMLRQAGAKEIHLRISSPPIISPCFYGIDTPTKEELIACRFNLREIEQQLNVDSLAYLSLESLQMAMEHASKNKIRANALCNACFTGQYFHHSNA